MQIITTAIIALLINLCNQALGEEINFLHPRYLFRSPNPQTKIVFSPSGLTISSTASSTGIYNLLPLNVSTRNYHLLIIKMKTLNKGIGEVSWTSKKMGFHPLRSYPFYLRRPGRYHTYYLNLAAYNQEQIPIDRLLFFPFRGPGTAEIMELKFTDGTLLEKILAGWQEFWGPRGREPDGFNFLVIRSPRLFGGPVLRYLNYFLLIVLVGVFLLSFKFDLRQPFLLTVLVLWAALELSSLVNNWIAFQRDMRCFGKNLEEKREMLTPKDFYAFLKFADRELPPGAGFTLFVKGLYNAERAQYYLYPRPSYGNAPYLLVFDRKVDEELLKKHRIWKEFRKGAYILVSLP